MATFIERKTRLYLAFKMPDRTSKSMFSATQIYNSIPKKFSKSFTSGRGTEFACYPLVEDLGIDFYFTDAYSYWQRGSNENANGLVGEYFPKKTDFTTISVQVLTVALDAINQQAGNCLGYKTALEAFLSEL